jgi:phosphate transport system permease protein
MNKVSVMADALPIIQDTAPTDWAGSVMSNRIRKRYAAERRFRFLGLLAVLTSVAFLAFLLISMLAGGLRGFTQTEVRLPINCASSAMMLDPAALKAPNADVDAILAGQDLERVTATAADEAFGQGGARMLSDGAWLVVRDAIKDNPDILAGKADIEVPVATDIDLAAKGQASPEAEATYTKLKTNNLVSTTINTRFFWAADSTDPTLVGIWGALKGSLLTLFITIIIAFPVGVLSALYLEEYAPRNRWTDLIEVSINNLAAVPSISFGLLGLAVFLNRCRLLSAMPHWGLVPVRCRSFSIMYYLWRCRAY